MKGISGNGVGGAAPVANKAASINNAQAIAAAAWRKLGIQNKQA